MKKPSLAIIGVGHWGKNLVREFSTLASIATYYNRNEGADRAWMQEQYPAIPRAGSVQEILQRSDIEAVVIATPIATHYDLVRDSLKAGKHVFCEKPLCETSVQAHELVTLAKEHNRTLFVGYTFCYHPVFEKLQDLLKNDPVQYANFHWQKTGSFREKIELNLLSHELSLILGLIGKPRDLSVTHSFGSQTERDIITLNFSFGHTSHGHISINRLSGTKYKAIILASKQYVYQWENDRLLSYDPGREEFKIVFESDERALTRECTAFIRSLAEQTSPLTDGIFAAHVAELIESVQAPLAPR